MLSSEAARIYENLRDVPYCKAVHNPADLHIRRTSVVDTGDKLAVAGHSFEYSRIRLDMVCLVDVVAAGEYRRDFDVGYVYVSSRPERRATPWRGQRGQWRYPLG